MIFDTGEKLVISTPGYWGRFKGSDLHFVSEETLKTFVNILQNKSKEDLTEIQNALITIGSSTFNQDIINAYSMARQACF
jgi:hypothetical protein